jgi:ABC-type sulfate transport system permease component
MYHAFIYSVQCLIGVLFLFWAIPFYRWLIKAKEKSQQQFLGTLADVRQVTSVTPTCPPGVEIKGCFNLLELIIIV